MKGFFKSVGYTLLLILVYMAFQFCWTLASVVLATMLAVKKGLLPVDVFDKLDELEVLLCAPATNDLYIWAMSVSLFLSAISMLLFLHFIKGYRLKPGLFRSMHAKPLLYSTLLVFSSMFALNIFVQWFGLKDNLSEEFDGLVHNVVGVVTIALLAPLLEEVLFRGAIQGYMMRRYNPWVAIVYAAVVFGVFHLNPVQSFYAALIGVVFGWIYYRTGSLLSVIVGHVLNNSLATVVLFFFPDGEGLSMPESVMSSGAQMASEVFGCIFFALLSVYFAIKLNASLPPVSSPWRDATDAVR